MSKYNCNVCQSALADTRPESIRRHEKSKKHLKALFSGINDGSIQDEAIVNDAKTKKDIVNGDSFRIKEYPLKKCFRIDINNKTRMFRYIRCGRDVALANAEKYRKELIEKNTLN